jgi:hypothetical protein
MRPLVISLALLVSAFILPGHAAAEVLISQPLERACLGHAIEVGVWHKATTDERTYRVQILDPAGRVVFTRAGEATDVWQIWSYIPRRTGIFRTIYYPQNAYSSFETRVAASGCFSANVAGTGSGPGHRFVVGDGLYLNFRDNAAYATTYRVCWQRIDQGGGLRCWSRRTSVTSHTSRIFTPAPERVGRYVAKWYVHGRLVASWSFYNGTGD